MPKIDPDLIQSVADINRAFYVNADWFPSNDAKLLKLVHAYEKALALRPAMISHGGSAAEELRFNLEVSQQRLEELQGQYNDLMRAKRKVGGFRQTQLSRGGTRW